MNTSIADLNRLERFGWRLGLQTMHKLLDHLGHPERQLRYIHITGSNGKGFTAFFLASYLTQLGYRTGLYTSPHLCDLRERFRMNGHWIDSSVLNQLAKEVVTICHWMYRHQGIQPTHFEALTAIGFLWFAQQKADWVVLEVGLGGRLDATNVIPASNICLFSSISLEHQDVLGKTIEKIAWEKSGILKYNNLAAALQVHPRALQILKQRAKQVHCLLWSCPNDFKFQIQGSKLAWEGPHFKVKLDNPHRNSLEAWNASLVLAGISLLAAKGVVWDESQFQTLWEKKLWPGRFEYLSPGFNILIDGAHNPEAAWTLNRILAQKYPQKKWIILNGFLRDKNYDRFIRHIYSRIALSVVTQVPSSRSHDGEAIVEAWEKMKIRTLYIPDWKQALTLVKAKASESTPVLITGSIYLIGACRQALVGLQGLSRI